MTKSEELALMVMLKELFRTEFQPVQQEIAALVTELRYKQESYQRIGAAVSGIERDLSRLLEAVHIVADHYVVKPKPPAAAAKVLPFTVVDRGSKKRGKKPKPSTPDDAA